MNNDSENIIKRAIDKIEKNRISTTEVADCLGKQGAILGVSSLNRGHFKVGKVFLVYGYNERNWEIHEQIQNAPEDSIVIVETFNCANRAVFGELVAKYLMLYRGVRAIAVNGYMRDASRLYKENYPIWCKGVTPIGCHNKKNETQLNVDILEKWKKIYEGSIAVCDDGGVVVIPSEAINEDLLQRFDFIELQEDIWGYCVNQKKWTSYETVCLQKYKDTGLLPKELKDKFEDFLNKINNS